MVYYSFLRGGRRGPSRPTGASSPVAAAAPGYQAQGAADELGQSLSPKPSLLRAARRYGRGSGLPDRTQDRPRQEAEHANPRVPAHPVRPAAPVYSAPVYSAARVRTPAEGGTEKRTGARARANLPDDDSRRRRVNNHRARLRPPQQQHFIEEISDPVADKQDKRDALNRLYGFKPDASVKDFLRKLEEGERREKQQQERIARRQVESQADQSPDNLGGLLEQLLRENRPDLFTGGTPKDQQGRLGQGILMPKEPDETPLPEHRTPGTLPEKLSEKSAQDAGSLLDMLAALFKGMPAASSGPQGLGQEEGQELGAVIKRLLGNPDMKNVQAQAQEEKEKEKSDQKTQAAADQSNVPNTQDNAKKPLPISMTPEEGAQEIEAIRKKRRR